MRYFVTSICLIIIMICQFRKNRFLLAAPVCYPIMWIFALWGLMLSKSFYLVGYDTLFIIIIGYLLFCLGFNYTNRGNRFSNIYTVKYTERLNEFGLTICFYIAVGVGALYIVLVRRYFSWGSFVESLLSVMGNKASGIIQIPTYLVYLSGIVTIITRIYLLLHFRSQDNIVNNNSILYEIKVKNRCIILFLISVVILLTNFSRNALLNFILPIIFIIIISKKIDSRKIVLVGTISFVLFLALFLWFSHFRDAYLYNEGNFWSVSIEQLSLYLSGSIVAFDQASKQYLSIVSFDGLNHTLSFLTPYIDRLIGTHLTPDVVLESISIGKGIGTNVYTVYYWNSLDLGIIYGVILQFVFGVMYGSFYKRMRVGSFRATFWYCTLSYSLIMMFFADQYTSIGPTWLLRIITYIIVGTICGVTRFKLGKVNRSNCF